MHLRFEYTFKDYLEANRRHSISTRIMNIVWFIVAPFMILGFILLAIGELKQIPNNPSSTVIAYLPVLAFFFLMSPWGFRLITYIRWKGQPTLQGLMIYEITEDEVTVITKNSKSEIGWETFTKFKESKNLFMLYSGRQLFHLIPKRAFRDESEETAFRKLAQEKVTRKRT